jgi:hypothetical protein
LALKSTLYASDVVVAALRQLVSTRGAMRELLQRERQQRQSVAATGVGDEAAGQILPGAPFLPAQIYVRARFVQLGSASLDTCRRPSDWSAAVVVVMVDNPSIAHQ